MPVRRSSRVSTRIRRTSPRQGPRAPLYLVNRMVQAVTLVVNTFIDRLMRALKPELRRRFDAQGSFEVPDVSGHDAPSELFLEQTFRAVDSQAAQDLGRVTGIPTTRVLPRAKQLERAWIRNNTELIQLPERARAEVRGVIEGPLKAGIRVEEVRAKLEERLGVVRSRAELIARDQTLKLYGQIQEARQTDAGIEEYTWSTSEDERVRSRHQALDGTTQRWDSPPIVDERTGRRAHPGGDFQCRCSAVPVLPSEGIPESEDRPRTLPPREAEPTPPNLPEVVPEFAPAPLPEQRLAAEHAEQERLAAERAAREAERHAEAQRAAAERARAERERLRAEGPPEVLRHAVVTSHGAVATEDRRAAEKGLRKFAAAEQRPLRQLAFTSKVGSGTNQLRPRVGGMYTSHDARLRIGVSTEHVQPFLQRLDPRDFGGLPPAKKLEKLGFVARGRAKRETMLGNTQFIAQTREEVIEMTTVHEYAHHLHLSAQGDEADVLIRRAFHGPDAAPDVPLMAASEFAGRQPVSVYGDENAAEFWAEAVTAYFYYPPGWMAEHTPKTLELVEKVLRLKGQL
jgi:SPP1 gp7 family putative phage head morphogenesis protein